MKVTPLQKEIARKIYAHAEELTAWWKKHAHVAVPPFYSSIDLRDSGDKIAPVDSNLFPAGFNNICPEDLRVGPKLFREHLRNLYGDQNLPKKILLLPESHTTNLYYIENLVHLLNLIRTAGFETELGWMPATNEPADMSVGNPATRPAGNSAPLGEPVELVSAGGTHLIAKPIVVNDKGLLRAGDFVPDWILLNNDFSSGYPQMLEKVTQPIVPSFRIGWHSRKKSEHFRHYNQLATEFATIIGLDPWHVRVETEAVDEVDFLVPEDVERVAARTQQVLENLNQSYADRKIGRAPFVFVKNNSGTYGIGILTVHSADELRKLNRREKNKMSMGKNKRPITSVVIQEGVPTATLVDRLAAEPVIYLLGCELLGGFLRTNTDKGVEDNLNSQGMVFRRLCMADLREIQDELQQPEEPKSETTEGSGPTDALPSRNAHSSKSKLPAGVPVLELVYGSIARISALAAGYELRDLVNRQEAPNGSGPHGQRDVISSHLSHEPDFFGHHAPLPPEPSL